MPLSKETKDRIAQEAVERYPPGRFSTQWLRDRELDRQQAHIAGAEAEAERAQGLVDAMIKAKELVNDLLNPNYNSPQVADKIVDIHVFMTKALTKYNNPA